MNEDKNTYFIKVQGKANIPEPLKIGHNFIIKAECSIVQKQEDDDERGGLDVTFKAQPISIEILDDTGKSIKAKDPRRNSVKIRQFLWKEYFNEGGIHDFDDVYDEATWVILSLMPQIYRETIKRLELNK